MVYVDEHPLAPCFCSHCGKLEPFWSMDWNSLGRYWCLLCRVRTDTYVLAENKPEAEQDRSNAS